MSKMRRVRRYAASAAAGATLAGGLAGCGSGGGGQAEATTKLQALASTSGAHLFQSITIERQATSMEVYSGTGTYDGRTRDWTASAKPLPVGGSQNNFNATEIVLDLGEKTYLQPASLTYVDKGASWIDAGSGNPGGFQNTIPLYLALNPGYVADVSHSSSLQLHPDGTQKLFGVENNAFVGTLPASAALSAMRTAGAGATSVALARLAFGGRTLHFTVDLTPAGKLGGFGYTLERQGSSPTVSSFYYVSGVTSGPALPKSANGKVVSLTQFYTALDTYNRSHSSNG